MLLPKLTVGKDPATRAAPGEEVAPAMVEGLAPTIGRSEALSIAEPAPPPSLVEAFRLEAKLGSKPAEDSVQGPCPVTSISPEPEAGLAVGSG